VVSLQKDVWLVVSTEDITQVMMYDLKTIPEAQINILLSEFVEGDNKPVSIQSLKDRYEQGWKNIAVELMFSALHKEVA